MKRRYITITLVGLTLTACATPTIWVNPNVSAVQQQQDQYACERDTRMASESFGYGYLRDYHAEQFYGRCLQSKGYFPAPKE